jgi:type IV pilus assembly protein PilX
MKNVPTRLSVRPIAIPARQQGMSLLVVLLLLVVVIILGLGSAQIALLAERTARSDRDYQVAWQSAESALADAQFDMEGPGTATRSNVFTADSQVNFVEGCGAASEPVQKGLCLPAATGKPVWLSTDLSAADAPVTEVGTFTGRTFDAGGTGIRPARKPRYVIEVLPDAQLFGDKAIGAQKKVVYRVTSIGFGPREDVQAVVQMLFRKE